MERIIWLQRALRAQERAIDFIAAHNPLAALNQLDEIESQIDMLLHHPKIGRPGRMTGTRELVIGRTPFIVVYRIKGKSIEILHFLHGAQQWP